MKKLFVQRFQSLNEYNQFVEDEAKSGFTVTPITVIESIETFIIYFTIE